MSLGYCGKENLNNQSRDNNFNKARSRKEVNKVFPVSKNILDHFEKNIVKPLEKANGTAPVTTKDFDGRIKAIYGKDADRIGMIFKIRSMLEANPAIRETLLREFDFDAAKQQGLPEDAIQEYVDGTYHVKLDKVSTPVLRRFYEMTYKLSNATTDKNFSGTMGQLRVTLETPRSMRWKDKTGAVAFMVKHINFFAETIQQNVTNFMDKSSRRDYGMSQVYSAVKLIVHNNNSLVKNENENNIKMLRYFQRIMNGWMTIEDGQVKIHAEYGPVTDPAKVEEGKTYYDAKTQQVRYVSTDDVVYDYQTLMTIEDYINGTHLVDKGRKKALKNNDKTLYKDVERIIEAKEIYLKLNKKDISSLQAEVERARKIHDEVFKDVNRKTNELEAEVLAEIKKWLPNKSTKDLKRIFVDDKGFPKNWTKSERQIALSLKEKFTGKMVFSVFTPDGNDMNYKKDSFPVLYNDYQFLEMLDNTIADLDLKIERLNDQILNAEGKGLKALLQSDLKKAEVARNWAQEALDKIDQMDEDPHTGGRVFDRRSAKHFKHISNVFDVRDMREDESVYYEYLRRTYGTIERSRLALRALQAQRLAKGGIIKDGGDRVIGDYVKALYDRTMHDPNARASVAGINMSMHAFYEGVINKLPFKISEKKVEKFFNLISQFLTARFLGGLSTAALNKTAVVQKIMEVGTHRWNNASDTYSNNKDQWDNLIKKAGVLEFGEFFSKSLVQDTSEQYELSEDEAFKLIKAQIQYQKDVKDMGEVKAMKKFKASMNRFVRTIDNTTTRRLKQRKSVLLEKYYTRMVGKFANFAITKEWVARKQSSSQLGKILEKLSSVQEFYGKQVRDLFPTMSSSEKDLRTNSFVIGVQVAQRAGIVPADLMTKIKEMDSKKLSEEEIKKVEADIERAIEFGREYTRRLDFGLSNQDVGEIGLVMGGFLTKFKYWAQQKFGYDVRVFRDAYWSLKSADKTGKFDSSAMGKTFKLLFKSLSLDKRKAQQVWKNNPDVGRLRNFVLTQGLMTMVMDLLIFGPFFGKIINKIPLLRSFGVTKLMGGMTSDLVTLTTTLPLWLAMSIAADDDEEEMQEGLYYKLRHLPFVGFGTTWVLDNFFFLFSMMADEDSKEVAKKGGQALRPLNPFDKIVPTNEVVEYMWD